MRFFIFSLACLGLSSAAYAEKPITMACLTQPATTTVLVQPIGDQIQAEIVHHNGTDYLPLESRTITPKDLEKLAKKAAALKKLGRHLKFTWPANKCQKQDDQLFECFEGNPVEMNGVRVEPYYLGSSRLHLELAGGAQYDYIRMGYMITMEGETHFVDIQYYANECYTDLSLLPQ